MPLQLGWCGGFCGVLKLVPKVTRGGDLLINPYKPGCVADRLMTGLDQPQVYP